MDKTRANLILAVLNTIGFLGTVVVNGLANALPLNGKTTGELSDQYPNLFVPTAITFSIWGIIYVLLAIFVVYGLVVAARKDAERSAFLEKIGILFFISCLANIGWITIATIANVTALLIYVNWNGFGVGAQVWAVVVIAVGIAISLVTLWERQDIFFCLVVDWALLGIWIKRVADNTVPDQSVIIAAITGVILISAGIIFQLYRKKVYNTA